MENAKNLISVIDLRRLLTDLHEKRQDVCIRYRMLGELWMPNFMSVFHVSEKGVMLIDEVNHMHISIIDLANVMQFEIDQPFQGFHPYFHYEVQPLLDYNSILS